MGRREIGKGHEKQPAFTTLENCGKCKGGDRACSQARGSIYRSRHIDRMWRFTRSDGITEGLHNKTETMTRQEYGFRNFESCRQLEEVL